MVGLVRPDEVIADAPPWGLLTAAEAYMVNLSRGDVVIVCFHMVPIRSFWIALGLPIHLPEIRLTRRSFARLTLVQREYITTVGCFHNMNPSATTVNQAS